ERSGEGRGTGTEARRARKRGAARLLAALLVAVLFGAGSGFRAGRVAWADRFWDLYQAGEAAYRAGDLARAVADWRAILTLSAGHSDPTSLERVAVFAAKLAQAEADRGFYPQAVAAWRQSADAWNALGHPQSALGPASLAREYRTDLRLYARLPADPAAGLLDGSGALTGGTYDADPAVGMDLSRIPGYVGRPQAILAYLVWGQPLPAWVAQAVTAQQVPLQLALEPEGGLSQAYDDAYLRQLVRDLDALGVPVLLRFAHEMNGSWVPWGGQPEAYRQAFRHVADVVHATSSRVYMVWAPNVQPADTLPEYYPGDDAVDFVGVDFYADQAFYAAKPQDRPLMEAIYNQGPNLDPLDDLAQVYQLYAERKPILVAETGVDLVQHETGQVDAAWAVRNVRRLWGYIPLLYPRVKGIFYFDQADQGGPGRDYHLKGPLLEAYRQAVQDPYYVTRFDQSAPYRYQELTDGRETPASLSLAAYVRLPHPAVDRVEYWLDGRRLAVATGVPYAVQLELPEGAHALEVRAYDQGGALAARRSWSVEVQGGQASWSAGPLVALPLDVPLGDLAGSWARDAVAEMVRLGGVAGYPDGSFRPGQAVTRAEMVSIVAGTLGFRLIAAGDRLPSVPRSHWAKGLLEGAAEEGLLAPEEVGSGFLPDRPVTRGEIAVWLVRALGDRDPAAHGYGGATGFADDAAIPAWQRPYVAEARALGLVSGYPDGSFLAGRGAVRAEAAVMVLRAFHLQLQRTGGTT
ncbi:MAG: S-layer homology domain-containing protein, partial [Clostridia bacterium]|nr:S-layer homology domain-containing protein [Clostridia bacterium]